MTKQDNSVGPQDYQAFTDIRAGLVTRAMAPLYGQSVQRLIAAGLVRLGADGVFQPTSVATPETRTSAPPALEPPEPPGPVIEKLSENVISRVTPSFMARVYRIANEEGIGVSDIMRRLLEMRVEAYEEEHGPTDLAKWLPASQARIPSGARRLSTPAKKNGRGSN